MPDLTRINKHQNGFALIEVLVTAVIVAIGVSGLGVLLMRAIQGTQDSAQQSQAMWMVQDFAGRIRANSSGARSNGYVIDAHLSCDTPPGFICAEYFKDGAEVSADTCNPTQMATFDVWTTVCGINPGIYDSASDFITDPLLTSTCTFQGRSRANPGQQDCVQYSINLNWSTRLNVSSPVAEERIQKNNYSLVVEVN